MTVSTDAILDEIFERFATRGTSAYVGEPVSVAEHMLQSAHLAELDGARPTLIAAALLHDYGHLVSEESENAAVQGVDMRHEDLAATFLSSYFIDAVVEPVRMHVAAKRYLCTVDPVYRETLSKASLLSLRLQGGLLTGSEVEAFEQSLYCSDAVHLRHYDDLAKIPGASVPGLDHYHDLLVFVRK